MKLFVFGLGYSVLNFVRRHGDLFEAVIGTVRTAEKQRLLQGERIETRMFGDPRIAGDLAETTHCLVSVPPEANDPALARYREALSAAENLNWIGYLSTIGVYGDHGGAWIDEATPPRPLSSRSRQRLDAEMAWLDFGAETGKSVSIFRLSGIYGPCRNALANLREGTAKRIVKPGQVFNRIHVDDIAAILKASIASRVSGIYNVTDDEPAPPQDVVAYAARIAGLTAPPEIPFEEAALSPMAASFYAENKRASNLKIKRELSVVLAYPTYREGLLSLLSTDFDGLPAPH